MNRKIIIQSDDFNREIFSFLKEVGADMPMDCNIEALERIKDAVIGTFEKDEFKRDLCYNEEDDIVEIEELNWDYAHTLLSGILVRDCHKKYRVDHEKERIIYET